MGCVAEIAHQVFKRGNLNGNKDQITDDPPLREQSWTLQHVGNK